MHSGITGLIEAAYAGGTFTVLILDNATTGMTGHQNHPATGYDIRGEAAPRLDLEAVARAAGVRHVQVVDPFDLPALEAALKAETARAELSVVIVGGPARSSTKRRARRLRCRKTPAGTAGPASGSGARRSRTRAVR